MNLIKVLIWIFVIKKVDNATITNFIPAIIETEIGERRLEKKVHKIKRRKTFPVELLFPPIMKQPGTIAPTANKWKTFTLSLT